jgi:phosphate transport system protein
MGTRGTLDRELHELQLELLAMSSMVDKAIYRSIEALRSRDTALAHRVIDEDLDIDAKRFEIEEMGLQILATQQPMAGDLRIITAVLSVVTDLERMGDHCEGVGKIVLMLADKPLLKPLVDLPRMAELCRDMLKKAMDAFIARDAAAANNVIKMDDEVDNLYDQVYHELLMYMIQDPRTIEYATYLLWTAHNYERIADRVTNICERVTFVATGQMKETLAKEHLG